MANKSLRLAHRILLLNTLGFSICFACWTLNGVLVTYLQDNGLLDLTVVEMGWLIGLPILSGSVLRLPVGIWADKYGGKPVFIALLLFCAVSVFLLQYAHSFWSFAFLSVCFGMAGTSFAVGIPYVSSWYPQNWQGRALGIFGAGNAGAAITTFIAPGLLHSFSVSNPNTGWHKLLYVYVACLLVMSLLFLFFAKNRKIEKGYQESISKMLLKTLNVRVWRFGLYYFLVFGAFVAFAQWLLPYYVNVYKESLVMAGIFTSLFSLPSGLIRALGGYLSDHFGARIVMYWVLGSSIVISAFLMVPRMEINTIYNGVMAKRDGVVETVNDKEIVFTDKTHYPLKHKQDDVQHSNFFPSKNTWQEAIVNEHDVVKKKQLIAQGITQIHFQANVWIYTVLVILMGISWGIGKAAVYKYIPEYFPNSIGLVGGTIGLLGGLGGFVGPVLFGYLLDYTGLWTSSWIFIFILSLVCFIWMQRAVNKLNKDQLGQKKYIELKQNY